MTFWCLHHPFLCGVLTGALGVIVLIYLGLIVFALWQRKRLLDTAPRSWRR